MRIVHERFVGAHSEVLTIRPVPPIYDLFDEVIALTEAEPHRPLVGLPTRVAFDPDRYYHQQSAAVPEIDYTATHGCHSRSA
jgi:hypothetical protein